MKITVAGVGYVGLSLAVLLAQRNEVTAITTTPAKAEMLNRLESPIQDAEIERFFAEAKRGERSLCLNTTVDKEAAYRLADLVIVATPTNYDENEHFFDTSAVEDAIEIAIRVNPGVPIAIKSTVPVGYTEHVIQQFGYENIIFSPEFLRESKALYDNLHPSRIVVGAHDDKRELAELFAKLLVEGAELEAARTKGASDQSETSRHASNHYELESARAKGAIDQPEHSRVAFDQCESSRGDCDQSKTAGDSNIPVLIMPPTEAEAVKLFANNYLATRVVFFNELDTYAQLKGLDTRSIIDGVCLDPRIGSHYNNPSFGYGGYCLPKDTKQLLANYEGVPQNLIKAVVDGNATRKQYIADAVLSHKPDCVGIYRLTMKSNSDNFRASAIQDVIRHLAEAGVEIIVYEPTLDSPEVAISCGNYSVLSDLDEFKRRSDIIIANRFNDSLEDVADKVYTRDIFGRD